MRGLSGLNRLRPSSRGEGHRLVALEANEVEIGGVGGKRKSVMFVVHAYNRLQGAGHEVSGVDSRRLRRIGAAAVSQERDF